MEFSLNGISKRFEVFHKYICNAVGLLYFLSKIAICILNRLCDIPSNIVISLHSTNSMYV